MTHPLFSLLSQSTDEAPESPPVSAATSLADFPPLAATTQQRTRGETSGAHEGEPASAPVAHAEPGQGWPIPETSGDVTVLAILDPPAPDGTPGRNHFAPGLTIGQRREILFDLEWFDVRVRRREREVAKLLSNSPDNPKENDNAR